MFYSIEVIGHTHLSRADILLCPNVEHLVLLDFNTGLRIVGIRDNISNDPISKFGDVTIDNVAWLNSLPLDAFQCLTQIEEVLRSCSSSLRSLDIDGCCNLRTVSSGLELINTLETLWISKCYNLGLSEGDDGMPWRSLSQSLCYLQLSHLPKLVNLPMGMQYLTTLQVLEISTCEELISQPSWMPKLTSLHQLELWGCSTGFIQCAVRTGEDWPNIQQIPSTVVKDKRLICFDQIAARARHIVKWRTNY